MQYGKEIKDNTSPLRRLGIDEPGMFADLDDDSRNILAPNNVVVVFYDSVPTGRERLTVRVRRNQGKWVIDWHEASARGRDRMGVFAMGAASMEVEGVEWGPRG